MIILSGPELELRVARSFVKFISIGEHVCGIDLMKLLESEDLWQVPRQPLKLYKNYVEALPEPTRSMDHVNLEFLEHNPIIMFESSIHDGRYHRFDGRHRIKGAWEKGITSVPALWINREFWSDYIVGFESKQRIRVFFDGKCIECHQAPYMWDRQPLLPDGPDRHYEKNFDIPSN